MKKKLQNAIGATIIGIVCFGGYSFLSDRAFGIAVIIVMSIIALGLATAKHQKNKRFASRRDW